MIVIPAIDFKNGKCVNLKQGRLDETTVYSDDPLAVADSFVSKGARRIHLVDLDGAFEGAPVNRELIAAIASNHPSVELQLGGGIRSPEIIEAYLEAGVDYLILGTKAVEEPEFVGAMCARFPGHIMVGLDGINGMVAKNGWVEVTEISVKSLALMFAADNIAALVYTDIGRDGMMGGINLRATAELAASVVVPVIASGGVAELKDIEALLNLDPVVDGGIMGVITGRAIYEGTLDLEEAIGLCATYSHD
ncbi:MAG: 1-(5-phosphoribosyl)-5-[(5-phosphoribosylamino)methylideneamino]imidazole-4-carboxamide isomerase [Gammaproteobacteria bacterium]|nr:1-(5-phosphoribosyl)-5-[(5-phosphoribosylamino)methylideneamino]imidazole-4-carboxamide isomerase [Gammaproteobacteria bacterium]